MDVVFTVDALVSSNSRPIGSVNNSMLPNFKRAAERGRHSWVDQTANGRDGP